MTSVVSENQIDDEEIKLDKSKKQPTIADYLKWYKKNQKKPWMKTKKWKCLL